MATRRWLARRDTVVVNFGSAYYGSAVGSSMKNSWSNLSHARFTTTRTKLTA